jgi:hypothetical protein
VGGLAQAVTLRVVGIPMKNTQKGGVKKEAHVKKEVHTVDLLHPASALEPGNLLDAVRPNTPFNVWRSTCLGMPLR